MRSPFEVQSSSGSLDQECVRLGCAIHLFVVMASLSAGERCAARENVQSCLIGANPNKPASLYHRAEPPKIFSIALCAALVEATSHPEATSGGIDEHRFVVSLKG